MLAGAQKAITAAILALFNVITVWVPFPEFISADWITTVIAAAFPLLVYFVPNKV